LPGTGSNWANVSFNLLGKMIKVKLILLIILSSLGTLVWATNHFSKSLWLHSSMFSNNRNEALVELEKKLTFYKKTGIDNLYIFNTLPDQHKNGWDFLKDILGIAHKKNIRIHPIITSGHEVRIEGEIKKHPEWLITDPYGNTLAYLNLSNPDVRDFIQKKISRLLKYNIDGIHLDYIRFPYRSMKQSTDSIANLLYEPIRFILSFLIPEDLYLNNADNNFSYDIETLELFEEDYNEPDDDNINAVEHIIEEWKKWNASKVTLLVKNIKELIKRSGKNIPLSAAVISNQEYALNSLGQNWAKWGHSGMVDVLCPMIYTNDIKWFRQRLEGVIKTVGGGCRVYAGIAIVSSHNKNTLKGVSDQIKVANELKSDGITIFSGFSLDQKFAKVISEN